MLIELLGEPNEVIPVQCFAYSLAPYGPSVYVIWWKRGKSKGLLKGEVKDAEFNFFLHLLGAWKWKKFLVAQSCPTLCDPMDCSLPGSSVYGILQARILEWAAISYFRVSSWSRDWTWASSIAGRVFTVWAPREASQAPHKTHCVLYYREAPRWGRCSGLLNSCPASRFQPDV